MPHGGAAAEGEPFVLTAPGRHGILLTAVNEAAAAEGLSPGLPLADARALLPGLATAPAAPAADAEALAALAAWCDQYSPWISLDGADGLWLDITGCAHLLGGEAALLTDLGRRLEGLGYRNRLGLADTPGAAWALARFAPDGTRVLAPAATAKGLAALPVEALRLSAPALLLLQRLGLRRIGALYDLPRAALARRFRSAALGEQVLARLDQALGRAEEPLSPLAPAPAYRTRLAFAEPIATLDSIAAALARLTEALCQQMEADRQGARRLVLRAYQSDGRVARAGIETGRPSRQPRHIERLFAERLEPLLPEYGIETLTLSAEVTQPLGPAQLSLDPAAGGVGEAAAELVDRLANRFGAGSVVRVRPRESHLPERAEEWQPAAAPGPFWARPEALQPPRPVRLFERPEPIRVLAEVPDGPPVQFDWRRVTRRVSRARGPERIAPEWWNDFAGAERLRDYYQVEDQAGRRYWLYREGLYQEPRAPAWYIHGLFA